jgi:hypothetical protein
MNDTFKILARFLDSFGEEVEGRELHEPTEEMKGKLRALARGNLPVGERPQLFEILNREPGCLAWLAQEVKSLRPQAK